MSSLRRRTQPWLTRRLDTKARRWCREWRTGGETYRAYRPYRLSGLAGTTAGSAVRQPARGIPACILAVGSVGTVAFYAFATQLDRRVFTQSADTDRQPITALVPRVVVEAHFRTADDDTFMHGVPVISWLRDVQHGASLSAGRVSTPGLVSPAC